jgi:hypothetical protein
VQEYSAPVTNDSKPERREYLSRWLGVQNTREGGRRETVLVAVPLQSAWSYAGMWISAKSHSRKPACRALRGYALGLAAQNPTSYGPSIELLSNILAVDKKTDRTAVLLKQGWLTYTRREAIVSSGGTPIEYEHTKIGTLSNP